MASDSIRDPDLRASKFIDSLPSADECLFILFSFLVLWGITLSLYWAYAFRGLKQLDVTCGELEESVQMYRWLQCPQPLIRFTALRSLCPKTAISPLVN